MMQRRVISKASTSFLVIVVVFFCYICMSLTDYAFLSVVSCQSPKWWVKRSVLYLRIYEEIMYNYAIKVIQAFLHSLVLWVFNNTC